MEAVRTFLQALFILWDFRTGRDREVWIEKGEVIDGVLPPAPRYRYVRLRAVVDQATGWHGSTVDARP